MHAATSGDAVATRTRTVLFTDLADYTAAVGRSDREGLRRLLIEHEELVSPIVKRARGTIVKNLGDSYMCLFDAATDALRAALDIVELTSSSGGKGGMTLRLGMATGDVEEIDGDAFGEPVNLASRILSKTPAGEVWFAHATRLCMNGAEIPWEPVGRLELKGIAGDTEVFRAVPAHRCWLPEALAGAVKRGRLVRVRRGLSAGALPPNEPVVLLEGFAPGSAELAAAVDALPVLDPASIWLSAYHISAADRHAWVEAGRGLVIGSPPAIERALMEAARTVTRSTGSDTILIDAGTGVDFVLVVAGLALPSVPLSEVVESYTYDLVADGRWVNRSDRALVRVEVLPEGARLHALAPGITVDGRARAPDEVVPLRDGMRFETAGASHVYRVLGEDFVGAVIAETAMRVGVGSGPPTELGREPSHPGLAFPDRRGSNNLRWCSGQKAARARAGGFTLDRALAGRRQCSVAVVDGRLECTPLHDRCPTWRLPAGSAALQKVAEPTWLEVGDHVVAGTTVVLIRGADALDE